MIIYNKPCLDEGRQVALLKSRGLQVADEPSARAFLSRVNYYRLSGYAIPFLIDRETFRPGATFDDLIAVYRFDRQLRDLLSEALEAAELAYRAILARKLSELHGPLGYRNAANFKNVAVFREQLHRFDRTIAESSEPCIVHFNTRYAPDQVPIWALVEVETFGSVTRLYENASTALQKAISAEYGIGSRPLRSYLQHLRVLRNFCAHHARLIGRRFYGYSPFAEWGAAAQGIDTRRLFCQFLFVHRLLRGVPAICFDREGWRRRVCEALGEHPRPAAFDLPRLVAMPEDAQDSPLWV